MTAEIFRAGGAHRQTTELGVGEVLAWRVWRIRLRGGHRWLYSLAHDVFWKPGPFEADRLPEVENSHGVYALKDHEAMLRYVGALAHDGEHVLGQVHLWGRVIEGELGYRAQFAEPVALVSILAKKPSVDLGEMYRYQRLKPWKINFEWTYPSTRTFITTGEPIEALRRVYTPEAALMPEPVKKKPTSRPPQPEPGWDELIAAAQREAVIKF